MTYTGWKLSHRADPKARVIADRHYNRQKVGSPQFVPPGRCIVLLSECERAFWVSSWPYPQYVKHAWAGGWMCTAFRSEGAGKASDMIKAAVAITRGIWGEPPEVGFVTFINTDKVRPIMRGGEPVWGYSWWRAGFGFAGQTKGGLLSFVMPPRNFPEPVYV